MTIDHEFCRKKSIKLCGVANFATLANLLALVLIVSHWQVLMENLG